MITNHLLAFPLAALACLTACPAVEPTQDITPTPVNADALPIAPGPFKPTWESLRQYQVPAWFRDAKFGIWAHWGPQCQPGRGDWYARNMYLEGHKQYQSHVEAYGHPSQVGFKDVIHQWKAEKWDPEKLVALYKRAGAKYFFAMANHHDNLDLYDSAYQPWNSLRVGPQKDIVGGWSKAARAQGLRFGVSVHAAHAWSWYEPSQGSDRQGPKAGVPYDGKLTKADGKGTWWDGLDPQDLYEQRHQPAAEFRDPQKIHQQWDWGHGATVPDAAYSTRFHNRTIDLIDKYQPDLVYFDDTALPLWPVSDAGLRIAAHYYNKNPTWNQGRLEGVIFGKILTDEQREALVWDIERGVPSETKPYPWQTCTCIGGWHYMEGRRYKSATTVVHMLADIVSKNGNLLLNVPVRGDGTIDSEEEKVVAGITAWMDVNQEAIFATRPWQVFGEGPASAGAQISRQGFNEGKGKPFTAEDVRYTTKGDVIYVIVLGIPGKPLRLTELGSAAKRLPGIARIDLLGSTETVTWAREDGALVIQPSATWPSAGSVTYRITPTR
jgi:alpha-L-fucosidase